MRKMFPAALLCLLLPQLACGPDTSVPAAASGQGLLILSEDPAHHGLAPEELEARGIRAYFHDFGRVPLGERARHVFRLENSDPLPVTITRMQASCGCTQPSVSYLDEKGQRVRGAPAGTRGPILSIPAGAIAEVTLEIETAKSEPVSHNADKLYTVQITTDSPARAYLRLEAHIVIERAFQGTPEPLELGRVPASAGASGKVEIHMRGTSGARILRAGELPPGLRADVFAEPFASGTRWIVEVALEPPLEPGPILRRFELMTEDAQGLPYYPYPLEVRAFAVSDVSCAPERFVVRNAATAGVPLEARVSVSSLLAGERLRVLAARLEGTDSEALELAYRPDAADSQGRSTSWTLTLKTRLPFPERIVRGRATVELEGRDPLSIDYLVNPR
jgi:hypothetical protein